MDEGITKFEVPGRLTKVGLILRNGLTFDEWLAAGEMLQRLDRALPWAIGDWLNYGETSYGETYSQATDATEYEYQTVADQKWLAGCFELSRRRESLSWSHHREVASLPHTQQDEILDQAEENRLTRRDVRRLVRQAKALLTYGAPGEAGQLNGKYRIIYADPPWKYGNEQPAYHTEQANHYALMDLENIAALPVRDITHDNAVLFLWVTSPILEEAFEIVEAWGFEYKSSFIWDKIKHNMGHYNSVRHELLLVCVRGSCLPDIQKLYDSVVSIERTEHSRKPEFFREIIDTIYPYGSRIELFPRGEIVENWEGWGNE